MPSKAVLNRIQRKQLALLKNQFSAVMQSDSEDRFQRFTSSNFVEPLLTITLKESEVLPGYEGFLHPILV